MKSFKRSLLHLHKLSQVFQSSKSRIPTVVAGVIGYVHIKVPNNYGVTLEKIDTNNLYVISCKHCSQLIKVTFLMSLHIK